MKKHTRAALGRGLSALISKPAVSIVPPSDNLARKLEVPISQPDVAAAPDLERASPKIGDETVHYLNIAAIHPNPSQPRKVFSDLELKELAESVKNMGVLQPVIVRPTSPDTTDSFEIVAGERRWRACQLAGLEKIPVIIKNLSNWESLEIALVENVQRQDLNPVDEANAYQALMDQYSLTQQDVAERIGKDRATVANFVRLLKLAPDVLELLSSGQLSTGHAKALLQLKDPAAQARIAKKVVAEDLSVRALENLTAQAAVLEGQKEAAHKKRTDANSDSHPDRVTFPDLIDRLRLTLGTKVSIQHSKTGRGKIEIEYFSTEELDRLIDQLCA